MKVLIYSHFFAPSVGGVETIVMSLARGLSELRTIDGQSDVSITVVTQTPARTFDDESLPFAVIREPSLVRLWQLIRGVEVVHVAGPALAPIFLAQLSRKRVIVEHHGFQTICPNGQLLIEPSGTPCPGHFMAGHHVTCLRCNAVHGRFTSSKLWLLTFVRRWLCGMAEANITPTAWLGEQLQIPHIVHIPHGLSATAFAPQVPAAGADPPIIAFQGRLVTTKGVRLLLEAARILREQNSAFQLLIIGEGPERVSLEKLAREAQLFGVHFAGLLPGAALETTLRAASIVVVPSLGGEVFGLVVAENMLRGLPVVASDLGAFAEVVGDAGRTFRTGDAAALAKELSTLLNDQQAARELGARARERALNAFSYDKMISEHARVLLKVAS